MYLNPCIYLFILFNVSRRGLANQMPSQLNGIMSLGFSVDKDSMSPVAVSFIQDTNDPVLLVFIPK